jgi:SAM-dependent methyltransferase
MEPALVARIKQVVAGNFDESFAIYDEFEQRYGFFAALTRALFRLTGLAEKSRVLDLGCGSGASSAVLAREFGCEVVGIDLSPKMVAHGRQTIADPRVKLLVGDACDPAAALAAAGETERFAAALYNASIFIIPEVEKSLPAAAACLEPGGVIAFSHYPELVAADGSDLFAAAFARLGMPRPKKQTITDYAAARAGLAEYCGQIREAVYERPLDLDFLTAFFSIPAQSASLFPRLDYGARKIRARELFATLEPEAAGARMIWRLAAGRV